MGSDPADMAGDGLESSAPEPLKRIVGIGASAGGLEALRALAANLLPGSQASYVVAQHLAPEHRSLIVDLLGRISPLPVITAVEGALLQADVIAIAPPHHDVTVEGDRLRVREPIARFGPSPHIDLLFDSIAATWGEKGAAVVLSGTGSDGARGLRAVRAAGGLTLVQTPEDARFDGMPRAAISLGGAELILSADAIGQRLLTLLRSDDPAVGLPVPEEEPALLSNLTSQLRHATGIDFSLYKENTLRRQVQRRMALLQLTRLEDYLPLLASDSDEAKALVQNLLVSVTSFFREPSAFNSLGKLLSTRLNELQDGQRLRVWVPGCATGEEVYSLAMLISSLLHHPADLASHLKIFATDLDETSLAIGRRATYPLSSTRAIPEELLNRFVTLDSSTAQINETLRQCVVFARHNVGEDPPFPNIDLISCRNTLIYFTAPLRDRVVSLFRVALVPGGLLFLGSSESLGPRIPGFLVVSSDQRIYQRTSSGIDRSLPPLAPSSQRLPFAAPSTSRLEVLRDSVPEQHVSLLEALLRSLSAPCLVLDSQHDLVEVIGDVTPYCQLPEGRINRVAITFLRPELQAEARALFLVARADGLPATSQALHLEHLDRFVKLEARPLQVGDQELTVLSFLPAVESDPTPTPLRRDSAFDQEIERLERDLLLSQESLRRSLVDLEEANEELEAATEELQATSEELQSSNEELEASNEELQATNEELATLNQQLRNRGDELQLLNNDLENIQSSLNQGMVLVDRDLRVTRFTPLAVRVFALMASDIGQPLLGVPTTVPLQGLRQALLAVVEGHPQQRLEASSEDLSYLVQVLPYVERDGRRLGAIVCLTDVSELIALRRTAEAALREFARLTDALDQAVWKRDATLRRVLYVSKRIQSLTGWSAAEVCERPEVLDQAIDPDDRSRVATARDSDRGGWTVSYRLGCRDGRRIWVQESAKVVHQEGETYVVGTLADVTEVRAIEERAEGMGTIFQSLFHSQSFGVAVLDANLRVSMANEHLGTLMGLEPASLTGIPGTMLFAQGATDDLAQALEAARRNPEGRISMAMMLMPRHQQLRTVQVEVSLLPQAKDIDHHGVLIVQEIPPAPAAT